MVITDACSNLSFSWLFTFRKTFPKVNDFNNFGRNLSCSLFDPTICTELYLQNFWFFFPSEFPWFFPRKSTWIYLIFMKNLDLFPWVKSWALDFSSNLNGNTNVCNNTETWRSMQLTTTIEQYTKAVVSWRFSHCSFLHHYFDLECGNY